MTGTSEGTECVADILRNELAFSGECRAHPDSYCSFSKEIYKAFNSRIPLHSSRYSLIWRA